MSRDEKRSAGRPRKTSQELYRSGAKPFKVAKRLAEEQAALGILTEAKEKAAEKRGLLLDTFIQQVKRERETFFERVVPGQTVCNEYGAPFNWREGHPLTTIKNYCDRVANGTILACNYVRLAVARFLGDLATGATRELFIDPIAVENAAVWFKSFGEPGLELQPWELFIVGQLLGWKLPTGWRRFREAWWEVAKKNGKTALMGGLAIFLTVADQERNAEVYSLANTRDQARICFQAALRWIEGSPELHENITAFNTSFVFGGSTYKTLSSESKTADGPNVHAAFFDEVHEFANGDLFVKITAGRAARNQPLIVSSTTAGNRMESFGGQKHEYFENLLNGIFEDDSKFVVIYALDEEDDWKDEALWGKANPNLEAGVVKIAHLREEVKEIENFPSKLRDFLRYNCNRWLTAQEGQSLPPERVNACTGLVSHLSPMELRKWFLSEYGDRRCFGGFDYGETSDMCCFTLLFPDIVFEDGGQPKLVSVPYYWIPSLEVEAKERYWRVPLRRWIDDGWIKTLPGNIADPSLIASDLESILDQYRVRDLGYDPWGQIRTIMAGFIERCIAQTTEVPQTYNTITQPSKDFKLSVLKGLFGHLNNPVLMWNCLNVHLEMDEKNGGMRPRKAEGSQRKKIDGVQATVTALQRALDKEANPWSIYNERGVLSLDNEPEKETARA